MRSNHFSNHSVRRLKNLWEREAKKRCKTCAHTNIRPRLYGGKMCFFGPTLLFGMRKNACKYDLRLLPMNEPVILFIFVCFKPIYVIHFGFIMILSSYARLLFIWKWMISSVKLMLFHIFQRVKYIHVIFISKHCTVNFTISKQTKCLKSKVNFFEFGQYFA